MSQKPRRLLPPVGGRSAHEKIELESFARRLHEALVSKGWSQSDLARELWGEVKDPRGFPVAKGRDRISSYINGKSYPEPATLKALAEALDMTPEQLAPDVMAAAIDRDNPALSITAVAGHMDKVHLRVNKLVPLSVAAKIAELIDKAEKGAA